MKFKYYVNLSNLETRNDTKIIVDLQNKQFKSIKVLSSVLTTANDIWNPVLKLNTFSGNGLTTDRQGLALCIFEKVHYIPGDLNANPIIEADWRYSTMNGIKYNIPPSAQKLEMSLQTVSGMQIDPYNDLEAMSIIFELEESDIP